MCYTSISGTLSPDEWDAAYLYMTFVLRKVSSKVLEAACSCCNAILCQLFLLKLCTKYLKMVFLVNLQRGQPENNQARGRRDRGLMHIKEEDIMYISNE